MCLKNYSEEDLPDVKEAYKCFVLERNLLRSSYLHEYQPRRRWLTSKDNGKLPYESGFHCFLNKDDAIKEAKCWIRNKEVVHRVLVKNITFKGMHLNLGIKEYFPSIVCRQIYIMEKICA
jgi:hypothetical protein